MSSSDTFFVFANWKMNFALSQALGFFDDFSPGAKTVCGSTVSLGVFPQALHLHSISELLKAKRFDLPIDLGIQNFHFETSGAFTGENSLPSSLDFGVRFAMIGHSERRKLFHESIEVCKKKFELAQSIQSHPLQSLFCFGETLEERRSGQYKEVLSDQLQGVVQNPSSVLLAYEPVWAIGTGEVASLEDIQEVVEFVRKDLGLKVPLLYGGSVNAQNAHRISNETGVNGLLVGGASQDPKKFADLIACL